MKMLTVRNLSAFLIGALAVWVLTSTNDAGAQTVGTDWTRLGAPPPGAWSLAPDPTNPAIIYALGGEGISRTTDGGATWAVCNRTARSMRLVTPYAGQPGNPILYAATTTGLRQSEDGCVTWTDVLAQGMQPSGAHVRWLAPYPNNIAVLYAGMNGLGGLYRSTDAGNSWHPASQGLPSSAWITALAADPRQPSRIILGLRHTQNDHAPAYVYKSTDGGLAWRSSSLGLHLLPNNGTEITGLAWSGDTLFASTASDGLYFSTNRGNTWANATMPRRTSFPQRTLLSSAPVGQPMPLRISALLSNPEGALLINTSEGAFQSLDGARTWQSFGPGQALSGDTLLAVEPNSGRALLAGSDAIWGYKLPPGIVVLPSATAQAAVGASPTRPPTAAIFTPTRVPPTPTQTPTATPTVELVKGPLPTDRTQPFDPAVSTYFEETGHNIKYGFRDFWRTNGGLLTFGYPLTEEFVENGVTVQYFERARLEYRDNKVGIARLGAELTAGQFFQTVRFFPSTDDNVYFGPTQHSVSGPFLEYWRDVGGLATLGFPLSESFIVESGDEYQWFERGRLEFHPNFPTGKRIVLGQIGKEALQKKRWIR